MGGAVSPLDLSIATETLNSRIRSRGLSAQEMWTQRDQFSNSQVPLVDQELISKQHDLRDKNHPQSEKSKSPLKRYLPTQHLSVGDLIYIHSDRNKSCSRDRYLVVSVEGSWCNVQKFVGSQLRSLSYRVKKSECYKVPANVSSTNNHANSSEDPS